MTRTFIFALMILGASATAEENSSKVIEWRVHHRATDAKSGVAYEMTEITQLPNESEDRIYLLVEDRTSGDRLVVLHSLNYFDHEVTVEVTDLDTKETAKSSSPLPYKSITRAGAADEIHHDPMLRHGTVPTIMLNVNGVAFTTSEAEWLSRSMRDKKSALRRAASPQFLERLERLRLVDTRDSPINNLCMHLLRYILYNETCTAPAVETKVAEPDCAFDGTFRFQCSKTSTERIAKAKQHGETLLRY